MNYKWRDTAIKIVVVLFCVSILLFSFSFVHHTNFTGKSIAEACNFPIGQSVYEGDSIVGDGKVIEVPLLGNVNFLFYQFASLDISGILLSLTTGVIPYDFTTVSSGHIDAYGRAIDFEGPGFLTYDGDNIVVKEPDNYIWGYSVPSTKLVKNGDAVDVVKNKTVIKTVPASEIKHQNWSSEFYNITTIQNWYNHEAKNGSSFILDKGISNFSDGRSNVFAEDVEEIFGKNISDYVAAYPIGTPIVLYVGNTTEEDGEVHSTTLGSHPEYGDAVREYNARQFVEAWNNTIIPPHSSGNGKDYIDFGSASDAEAPGGSASHGVCPPARVLRDLVLAEGFSMPVGMVGGENAVLFGFNPSEDIKVTNNLDVPVKIVMWYKGEGPGMGIYGKIIKLEPA